MIPRHMYAPLGTRPTTEDADNCAQLIDLRLPGNLNNSIRVQPAAFNEQAYRVEPSVSYKDEKGILNTKHCAVTNFIRWRYASDADSGKAKDSL